MIEVAAREVPVVEPLRGPLGLRTLLRGDDAGPMLARLPVRRRALWLAGLGGVLAFGCFWILFGGLGLIANLRSQRYAIEVLWSMAFLWLAMAEAAGAWLGAWRGSRGAASAWRNQLRLPELKMTALRPVEIGRLMLHRQWRTFGVFAGVAFAGFLVNFVVWVPLRYWAFLIPFTLAWIHMLIAMRTESWSQLAIALAFPDFIRQSLVTGFYYLVLLLCLVPLVLLPSIAAWSVMDALGYRFENETFSYAHVVCIFPMLAIWGVRILFARAFAARLEQVVFANMKL